MLVASQTSHSKFHLTILVSLLSFLIGCSRDNPLSTPDAYIEPETPFCTDDSPFSFKLLDRVDFTNTNNDFEIMSDSLSEESANNREVKVEATAPYLSNFTIITPLELTNFKRDEQGQLVLNDENEPIVILLDKELTPEMLEHLSEDAITELEESVPEITSISYSIEYLDDGVLMSETFDEELTALEANLLVGQNRFTLSVNASVIVQKTGLECSTSAESESLSRVVSLKYDTEYTISRAGLVAIDEQPGFTATDLNTNGLVFNANDRLGEVIAVNDQFLVLGVPNESSSFTGVVSVAELVQNTNSLESGAAFVFTKDEDDNWMPHSVIKSSNNEAGDRFGADVSLAGSYLVISAPGEDSNASGIHDNTLANTLNLKINNGASNSGAVYLFKFDTETEVWQETHYIKPDENVISDADYDKGFGKKLEFTDELLLVSAPNENSNNGDPANSTFPNSGAVYVYSFSAAPLELSFVTTLKALNPGTNDLFGSSISISDTHIAVSAPFEDNSKRLIFNNLQLNTQLENFENNLRADSGAVYLYSRSANDSQFELTTYIKSTNSDEHDFFGTSLKLNQSSLIVGAIGEDSNGTGFNREMLNNESLNSGAVYLYTLNQNTNNWVESLYIKANDTQAASNFGQYLDFDKNNIVISAPTFDDIALSNAGKVYLYEYKAGQMSQISDFISMGSSENMQLGNSLSLKNKHLILGASGFIDESSGNPIPAVGKLLSYQ